MGDFRHAGRLLIKAPGFTATAIVILALAIAGNTATFSAVDVLLLEPLPFTEADRLVVISTRHRATGARAGISDADYRDWSSHATTFDGIAAVQLEHAFNLSGGPEPVRVTGALMTANLLPLLGVSPLRGRGLLPQDEAPGAPAALLITERFWERRFNRNEAAVGAELTVDGVRATIVGVLPASFRLLYGGYSIWAPLATVPAASGETVRSRLAIARLAAGSTPERSAAELAGLADAVDRGLPERARGWRPRVLPIRDFLLAGRQHTLLFVITALGVLLLVACANTASLQLARATARQQEIATRLALGASRSRVVRELLAEAVIVAVASATLALGIVAIARKIMLAGSPDLRELRISLPVLGFTIVLTLATTIAFGLVPALTATRLELATVIKGAFAPRRTTRRLLSALVVLELAASLVLLVPAGLLFRSFAALRQMDPGFAVEDVLTFSIALPAATYPDARRQRLFHDAALERLSALPGVRAVAAADALPLDVPPTRHVQAGGGTISALTRTISADYFRALGIRVQAGRAFGRSDDEAGARVAIVNETMARTMRPDGQVLGATIAGLDDSARTIVGVTADLRSVGVRVPPQPEVMLPLSQAPRAQVAFAIAVDGDPALQVAAARAAMRALDADIPVASIRLLSEIVDEQVAAVRAIAALLAALALLALLLASAGLSGLMSRFVAQRTREFGVRAALGATSGDVVRLVMRDAGTLVAWGLVLGLPAAAATARIVSSMLWGVSAADVRTFIAVPIALAGATCAACYLPARRAARLDPAAALRST